MLRENIQVSGIAKLIGSCLGGQAIFTFIGILSLVVDGFAWPWWPGILGMSMALFIAFSVLMIGVFLHRAYYLHSIMIFTSIGWAVPLLGAGYANSNNNFMQLFVTFILCALSFAYSYRSTTKKLLDMKTVHMLDIKTGYWDLSKTLVSKEDANKGASLARVLIPFGVIIGSLLSRSSSDQNVFNSTINYFLSVILFSFPGIQLAIVIFLARSEKVLRKEIFV